MGRLVPQPLIQSVVLALPDLVVIPVLLSPASGHGVVGEASGA